MPFLPSIPQITDFQDNSQAQLLSNNIALDASFENDHTKFSDTTANNGLHKKVTLYQVATDPTLTFPQSALYSKNSGTTPNQTTSLFYATKPETGAASYLQMTNITPISFTNTGLGGGTGYVLLTPWNMVFMWGLTASAIPLQNIVFPVAVFPAGLTNSTYTVQLTIVGSTQPLQEVTKNNTHFETKQTTSPGRIEWFVFGVI